MSLQAFGKVPPYQDISHFRAPYKNAIFAGFGAVHHPAHPAHHAHHAHAMHPAHPAHHAFQAQASGAVQMYVHLAGHGAAYTTSVDPAPKAIHPGFRSIAAVAEALALAHGMDVIVHSVVHGAHQPHGPTGDVIYVAHAPAAMHGFGQPTHHHHKAKHHKQHHKKPHHKQQHGQKGGHGGQSPMSQAQGPISVPSPIVMVFYQDQNGATFYTTSLEPTPVLLTHSQRVQVLPLLKTVADHLAEAYEEDVIVHRSSGPNGPVGGKVYEAYANDENDLLSDLQGYGLGDDPAACVAPKWVYSETTGNCACAPEYAPTPDGTDCIPFVNPNAPSVPPTGGLSTWGFTNPETGATAPPDAGVPTAAPAPAAVAPACAGYQLGSTCVPTWAAWVGGGLAALLVLDLVL